jgi:stearoyl-CoA desaturase (delta-9 desaturase)
LTLGELFQNNHHRYGMRPNFGTQRWEIDPTYWSMRLLAKLGIIKLEKRTERRLATSTEPEPEPAREAA